MISQDNPNNDEEIERSSSFSFSFLDLLKHIGPGILIAVSYLDPGNISGDMEAGLVGKYSLLWILLLSNTLGFFFQIKSMKLGMVTGNDLSQLCRIYLEKHESFFLWIMAEIAIIGSDIQEVLGTAISLNILFNLELWKGVILTIFSTFIILIVRYSGPRKLEMLFALFIGAMAVSFFINLLAISPEPVDILKGFIPSIPEGAIGPIIGLIGSVLMPANLFLHSSIIAEKKIHSQGEIALQKGLFYHKVETGITLTMSFIINGLILCTFAFYFGKNDSIKLNTAADALQESFGTTAKYLWGIGLFASGQSTTLTGTLAGQFVMSGFLKLKMSSFQRALLTRSIAIIPSLLIVIVNTDQDFNRALNVLQVIQLPFTIIPLLKFSNCIELMGKEKIGNFELSTLVGLSITVVFANLYHLMPSQMDDAFKTGLVFVFLLSYSFFIFFIFNSTIKVENHILEEDSSGSGSSQPEESQNQIPDQIENQENMNNGYQRIENQQDEFIDQDVNNESQSNQKDKNL